MFASYYLRFDYLQNNQKKNLLAFYVQLQIYNGARYTPVETNNDKKVFVDTFTE